MLNSPQAVTISGTAHDLNRIVSRETSSVYQNALGTVTLDVSHQTTKTRKRHLMKISQTVIAADPLTAVNREQTASVHIVVDEPIVGFSDAELDAVCTALKTWATSAQCLAILSGRH